MVTGEQDRIVPSTAGASPAGRARIELPDGVGHLIFWPILLLGLLADLGTKRAVFARLQDTATQSVEILDGILSFRLALNAGAAFGILPGRLPFLAGVSIVALLAIVGVFFLATGRQRILQVALGLFAAGVCGNLWDRLFNDGHVRDFIDVVYWPGRHWHTFNVADALLCGAVGLLLVTTFLTGSSDRTHAPPQK
ncbi:MAG: signal peptidase II [Planctomycetes bacterium]|jgi:signal peptidase II|nr:signal peptidase II [Planctomycetota bacterium]